MLRVLTLISVIGSVYTWTSEELALYDLVEEIGTNFYSVFDIEKDAPLSEIKKSYRRLSLEFHPDRNKAEDAATKFRQVVSIYETLKSEELRQKYNEILEFGLPSWRSGVYYYRRVRKMSLMEAIVLLLPLLTFVHYLMLWGAYWEKYLVETQKKIKVKREKDRLAALDDEARRVGAALEEYRPTWTKMLPAKAFRFTLTLINVLIELFKKEEIAEEVEVQKPLRPVAPSQPQPVYNFEVATDIQAVTSNDESQREKYEQNDKIRTQQYAKEAPWSCDDLVLLVKLSTEKFPVGTPYRWEKMGSILLRPTTEVIAMAGKIKNLKREEYDKLLAGQTSSAVNSSIATNNIESTQPWTVEEQKKLEASLAMYTKDCPDRWEKIFAEMKPRTRREVIQRFKECSAAAKKKKSEQ